MIFPGQEQKTRLKNIFYNVVQPRINPDNASYQYAILPGKTPEKRKRITIIRISRYYGNDLRVQAVRENKLGVTGQFSGSRYVQALIL